MSIKKEFIEPFALATERAAYGAFLLKGMNDKISLVWIYNDMDHPQIIKRMKLVGRILENRVENQIKLNYNYSSLIESLLNATIYTDILSYYVAILGGVNPTPVDIINVLKSEL